MEKSDGREYSHDVLEAYRYRAIELYQKRKSVQEIAFFFGVHRGSVSLWIKTWKEKGKSALKSKKALGPEPKLRREDRKKIISIVRKPATEYGFETPLWTCKRLKQIIKNKLKVNIATSNVWRWLIDWGLTNQRPEKIALQKDEKEVKRWLKEEWHKIDNHRRRWQAMLYFLDESGVSLIPVLGKTWAPKGKTPKVKVTGNKGGICVTSAISPAGRMVFRLEKDTVKAEQHIEFLKQIIQHHKRRKIIIIEDNAKPHIAKEIKHFVEKHKNKIAIYYLPTYSPDLNPDERVWNHLKNHKLKAHQARSMKEFRPILLSKLRSIQKDSSLISSFFVGTYVI